MAEASRFRDDLAGSQAARALVSTRAIAVEADSLDVVRAQPELAVLAAGHGLMLDADLEQPFLVTAEGALLIDPSLVHAAPASAVLLRHGLELAWLQRISPGRSTPARSVALALSACRTAALYLASCPESFRAEASRELPAPLMDAYRALSADAPWANLALLLGPRPHLLEHVLPFSESFAEGLGIARDNAAVRAEAINLFAALGALSAPTEALIATGGDTRIALDRATGRNGYGSSNRPRPDEVSFSSSTASSISPDGYRAAEDARRRLIAAAAGDAAASRHHTELLEIRSRLAAVLGLGAGSGVEIVLTASGTDSEVVATALCSILSTEPLTSIIVAPDETGSGVPLAAAGRHFSSWTALGAVVAAGTAVAGFGPHPILTEVIAIRDDDGRPRSEDAIGRDVEAVVDRSVASGRRPVLHAIDAAKTGLGAPGLETLRRIRARHGEAAEIIVDACQMRLDPSAIRAYLGLGVLVQITGSKFYGGPPFSGALLVPRSVAQRLPIPARLPEGVADYSARAEWPDRLSSIRVGLRDERNPGLVLRWHAALAEMVPFSVIDPRSVRAVLSRFERDVVGLVEGSPHLRLIEAPPMERPADDSGLPGWSQVRTILPFLLLKPDREGRGDAMSFDEVKAVHARLGGDRDARLMAECGEDDMRPAITPCLLGQPVRLAMQGGATAGALRLCASARLVRSICEGPDGVDGQERRYAAVIDDVRLALRKIALILRKGERQVG